MAILVTSYVRMHVCTYMQGTDSFEGVMHPNIFEGIFQIDTVEGVHAWACMFNVKWYLEHRILVIKGFVGWFRAIIPFLWLIKRCKLMSLWNGIQRLVGFFLTSEQKHQKYRG